MIAELEAKLAEEGSQSAARAKAQERERRQLEEARQENRIRAQALSDRQCQTTALHERHAADRILSRCDLGKFRRNIGKYINELIH